MARSTVVVKARPRVVRVRPGAGEVCRRFATGRRVVALVATLLGVGACSGPGSKSWAAEGKRDADGALKVLTTSIEQRTLVRYYTTSGTLRARRSADLVATQPGLVQALLVEEGAKVKEGDVLARLDGRSSSLQAAQAGLQLQNLERELERLKAVQGGAVSKEEIDKQRYLVEEARAALKLSKHQVGLTVVRAPFDGTIVTRHVDVGALAGSTTPLFSIADLHELELELHLPERDAATVKADADVEIELVDGSTFTAKMVRRAPIVDAATGTVKFIARAAEFPPAAAPGAFARAKVLVEAHEGVPSLPRSAMFEIEGKPHVYVLEDGKARRRPIELRMIGTDAIEIGGGVSPGDQVVADGNAGITEGMPLQAAAAEATKPSSEQG